MFAASFTDGCVSVEEWRALMAEEFCDRRRILRLESIGRGNGTEEGTGAGAGADAGTPLGGPDDVCEPRDEQPESRPHKL